MFSLNKLSEKIKFLVNVSYKSISYLIKLIVDFLTANHLLYTFSVPIFSFIISFIITKPIYNTNDDVAMRLFAEGIIYPKAGPSEFLLFINVLYGRFLKFLYISHPGIPWYDICFASLMLIAFFVLSYCLWQPTKNYIYNFFSTVFLGIFFFTCFTQIQFSIVSSVLFISAAVLAIKTILSPPKLVFSYFPICLYIIFGIFVSALIRFQLILIVGLFAFILACFVLNKKHLNKTFLIISIMILFGFIFANLGEEYNRKEYKTNPIANHALEYNFYRSEVQDRSYVYRNNMAPEHLSKIIEPSLNKINWSRNDYLMFHYWCTTGNDLYDLSNMKKLYFATARQVQPPLLSFTNIKKAIKFPLKYFFDNNLNLLLIISLAIIFLNKKYSMFLIASHLAFCLFLGLEACFFREVPFRVYYPLNLLEYAFFILKAQQMNLIAYRPKLYDDFVNLKMSFENSNFNYKIKINGLITLFLAMILCINCSQIQKEMMHDARETRRQYKSFLELKFNPNSIYLISTNLISYVLQPYEINKIDWRNKLTFGWIVELGVYQKKLQDLNLHKDLYLKTCSNHKIFFLENLMPEYYKHMPIRVYLQEHYGFSTKVNFRSFPSNNNTTLLYQIECIKNQNTKAH